MPHIPHSSVHWSVSIIAIKDQVCSFMFFMPIFAQIFPNYAYVNFQFQHNYSQHNYSFQQIGLHNDT